MAATTSSSSSIRPATVLAVTVGAIAASGIGYALYFDYKRRNDPVFRRALLKEKRSLAKASAVAANKEKASQLDALRSAVRQLKNEAPPSNVEEREAYFLEQVAVGEALAAKGSQFYVPAAISFFKGLQVYPQPQELLMIYSKTQPAAVVQLIMEALKLSISDDGGSASASASARRSQPPRGNAILEEIDVTEEETKSATSKEGEKNSSTSSPSSKSYVDVDFPTIGQA